MDPDRELAAGAPAPPAPVLDHVQIAAPRGCEPAARRFYGELLGLAELKKPEPLRARGGAWFALGGGELHVGVEEPFHPARKAHPALRVAAPALDALAARLVDAGAPVRWDAELTGVRRFFTEDPWGNRLELLSERRAQGEHATPHAHTVPGPLRIPRTDRGPTLGLR